MSNFDTLADRIRAEADQAAPRPVDIGGGMSTDQARDVLVTLADVQHLPAVNLKAVLRKARHRAHPDRNGGDRALWDEVEQAASVLGLLDGAR